MISRKNEILFQNKPVLIKTTDDIIIFEHGLIRTLLDLISNNYSKSFVAGGIANAYHVDYATGCGYFISPFAVKQIYEYARCIEDLPYMDDVILAGTLRQILNIQLIGIGVYSVYKYIDDDVKRSAEKLSNAYCLLHAYPSFGIEWQYSIWKFVEDFELLNENRKILKLTHNFSQ